MSPRRSFIVLMATLVVAAAGCQTSDDAGSKDSGAGSETKSSGKDLTFDLFLGDKLDLIEYAKRVLVADCMNKQGFPQLKQSGIKSYDGNAKILVIDRHRFRGFASEQEARQHGFGRDQAEEPPPVVSSDPSFDAALAACGIEADKALGEDSRATLDAYSDLGNQLSGSFGAWVRPALAKEMGPMLDCLAQRGYKVDDREKYLRNPYNMRHFNIAPGKLDGAPYDWQPKKKPGTVDVGPPKPHLRYVPSSQEADFAAAWYHCDQSTHRLDNLLEGAQKAESEVVAKFEDKLTELNPEIEAIARKATQLVGAP